MPTAPSFERETLGTDREALRRSIANRLVYSIGKDPLTATSRDWFHATAYAVRERLIGRWMETMRSYYRSNAKRVYYLSLEFLTGRLLTNGLGNMGLTDVCREALSDLDLDLDELRQIEHDAALGNGGLGRLAACFLDSMATLSLPGYGYGIRYEYGMFQQHIEQGRQVEQPDNWLRYGNPWEFPRPEVQFPVRFGGRVVHVPDASGVTRAHWTDTDVVMAMAFDTPVPGYGTNTVNNMRLWSAKASQDLDLADFNDGQYLKAVERKNTSENLSKVLYPSDATHYGRSLRLRQQHFFVSASLQDILRRFLTLHDNFDEFPDQVAVQLNDTHPSIAVAELMRLLVDEHGVAWDRAWAITRATFSYTNHTLMPEALESWPVDLLRDLLPRHLEIIYEINQRFLDEVRHRYPGDTERVRRMSIIGEDGERRVRMAHLAIVGSHAVNGVSAVHTDLMRRTIFADFDAFDPGRILNVTNGVTPRRWLKQANPPLSGLVTDCLGEGWIKDLRALGGFAAFAGDPEVRRRFREAKVANKVRLADLVEARTGVAVDPAALFDVHIKRVHEYKRQLLNVLHIVTRYNRLRQTNDDTHAVPRVVLFSGKAAPGYARAKLVIELIHGVADVINHDPAMAGRLAVAFIPDYGVSTAEQIVPASDLSEQISTAGTEASGTGNMKLALNGALTIGTLDGANIEMRDAVGAENMFIFGLTADEVAATRMGAYDPLALAAGLPELALALEQIASGFFSPEVPDRFMAIVESLTTGGDHYRLVADYAAYVQTQDRVDAVYRDVEEWSRRAVLNVAGMGQFSSDRAVMEYATRIWGVTPQPR